MADDQQVLIGKWTVRVKEWVWEYEFLPNGVVTWRDTRSLEKGTGRWSMSPTLVNLSWSDSTTKESWQRPLSALSNKRTFYSAPYYTGPYQIEKTVVVDPQKDLPPDWEVDIDTGDPRSASNYIDKLCTHVAYGIYNGGYWVYVLESFSPHPITIPESMVWFANSGQPVSDKVFGDQASAIKAAGGVNPDRIAYYEGVGGKIICPTAFTLKTAPTIVNTASIVVDRLIAEVTEELKDIMMMLVLRISVDTAGAVIGRAAEVRRLKARDARAKAALENARARQSAKPVPVRPIQGKDVNDAVIRAAMKNAPLKSQQKGGISLPKVQEFVDKLNAGETPPPIKVDDGIIVEGNHRYIAGRIAGKEPPVQQWAGGRPERVVPWDQMPISPNKW